MAAACSMSTTSTEQSSIRNTTPVLPGDLSWYAIQIKSRLANVASATLHGKGYEELLPLYPCRRQWSDRIKVLELPLFPRAICSAGLTRAIACCPS